MGRIKVSNGTIITPLQMIQNGTVLIDQDKIVYVGEDQIVDDSYLCIDAQGKYVAPGLIDLHCHGGSGHDFMDGTVTAYLGAAEMHAQHGTTTMIPTTLTGSMTELKRSLQAFQAARREKGKGANLSGLHLEGPYLALTQKGAQDGRYIKNPNFKEYAEILESTPGIVRWSAAPELPGALAFGEYMRERGILPSIAHTDAVYEDVQTAFLSGFTHITHLYSGMNGVTRKNSRRFAGVVESALLIDEMTVEMIADGVHLPGSLLNLVYKIKGPEKIALVTDAMRAAGMPDGESILGSIQSGHRVIIEEGVAKLPDRSSFAGSVATVDRLICTCLKETDIPLHDIIRMASLTPATIIGLQQTKGSLETGKDADLVIFDENITMQLVMIGGQIVKNTLTRSL